MANTEPSGTCNSNKKSNPSPEVVSNGACFRFKSFLRLCRCSSTRDLPSLPSPQLPPPAVPQQESLSIQNPALSSPSSIHLRDREAAAVDYAAAADAYRRRARELEEELRKLQRWLAVDKILEMGAAAETVKLSDGSYLREIRKLGRPWGALVMQISDPLIAENATTAAEVIGGMATWERAALMKHMHESMPMRDLQGRRREQITGRRVAVGSEANSAEGLLLSAMEEMEELVLEGLRVQMGSSGGGGAANGDDEGDEVEKDRKEKDKARGLDGVERMVLVMMIQVRDPAEKYAPVGEAMLGLIEAAGGGNDGRLGVQRLHIAGLKRVERRRGEGKDFIWSTTSLRDCNVVQYVRNPDMFMP